MQELTSYQCFPSCSGRSARVDVTPVAKAFDKVSLMAHLVKDEEGSQDPNSTTPRAGRPTPVFADVKDEAEELSGTIPWAVPVKPSPDRSVDGKVAAKASHHHHRVEVAHHHHHHLQPAPSAHLHTHHIPCLASPPPQMIFVDDCSRFAPDERHCPQPSAGIRAEVCHGGQTAASPAPVNRQRVDLEEDLRLSSSEEDEEKFTSGMRRMITRAELHRLHELHRRHHL